MATKKNPNIEAAIMEVNDQWMTEPSKVYSKQRQK